MPKYDAVVVGAGVFGAWIAYRLRLSGRTVALVEALGPGNSRSSSGGESRIIRSSYGSDEIYSRWAQRSLQLWTELFEIVQQPALFQPTGMLWTAPGGHPRVESTRAALANSGVPFEELTHADIERQFPQFHFSSPVSAIYEPRAGVLLARRAVQAVVAEVERGGVQLIYAKADAPAGIGRVDRISTSLNDSISGDEFIYACGPWLPRVFPNLLGNRIHPTRQELFFIGPPAADRSFSVPNMPAWFSYGEPAGAYSIPDIESRGFKLAFDLHGPNIDPDTADRVVSPESLAHARAVLRERFPALANSPIVETRVCQYENTSNGDFLIDRHPDFENVWIAGGGSGHGFKHGPAVGEYVERLLSRAIKPERRFALSMKMAARARAVY